jgi:hypothetical protein
MTGTGKAPRPEARADLPPDALDIGTAGRIVGLSTERIRQLAKAGFAHIPARGFVSLTSLLAGYSRALQAEAARPESAALGRQNDAKAALIRAATERRRGELVPREDAETALAVIRETAARHLRGMMTARALKGLSPEVAEAVRREVRGAIGRIEDADADARAALVSGDFSVLSGEGVAR